MYTPVDEFARAHQDELLREATIERSLRQWDAEKPGLRDRILIKIGDWMIALGCRMLSAARTHCASQELSNGQI
jgi:hypothetical protein